MGKLRTRQNNGRRTARRIMEKCLGRKLERWEDVHHIDGNPSNNNLANLTIMECGEHSRFHRKLENKGVEPYDHKKYMRTYNKQHREKLNAYMRGWRKKNPEKLKEIKHRSYLKCRKKKECLVQKGLCPFQDQARRVSAQSLKHIR